MSKKINYGNQMFSSSERLITLSASAGSSLKIDDVSSFSSKGTTEPTISNPSQDVVVSLEAGSTDMAGTIVFNSGLSAYTGTKICDFTFEIPKTTKPFIIFSENTADCAYFENPYIVPTTAGFSMYRRNIDFLIDDAVGKWSYLVIGS